MRGEIKYQEIINFALYKTFFLEFFSVSMKLQYVNFILELMIMRILGRLMLIAKSFLCN